VGGGRLKDGDARNVVFTPQRRRARARAAFPRARRAFITRIKSRRATDRPTDGTITPRRRRIAATGNSPPPH